MAVDSERLGNALSWIRIWFSVISRIPVGLSMLPLIFNMCAALLASDAQAPARCPHSAPQKLLTAAAPLHSHLSGALVWLQRPSLPPVSFSPPNILHSAARVIFKVQLSSSTPLFESLLHI